MPKTQSLTWKEAQNKFVRLIAALAGADVTKQQFSLFAAAAKEANKCIEEAAGKYSQDRQKMRAEREKCESDSFAEVDGKKVFFNEARRSVFAPQISFYKNEVDKIDIDDVTSLEEWKTYLESAIGKEKRESTIARLKKFYSVRPVPQGQKEIGLEDIEEILQYLKGMKDLSKKDMRRNWLTYANINKSRVELRSLPGTLNDDLKDDGIKNFAYSVLTGIQARKDSRTLGLHCLNNQYLADTFYIPYGDADRRPDFRGLKLGKAPSGNADLIALNESLKPASECFYYKTAVKRGQTPDPAVIVKEIADEVRGFGDETLKLAAAINKDSVYSKIDFQNAGAFTQALKLRPGQARP